MGYAINYGGGGGKKDLGVALFEDVRQIPANPSLASSSMYIFGGNGFTLAWNNNYTILYRINPDDTLTSVYTKAINAGQQGGFTEVDEGCFVYYYNYAYGGDTTTTGGTVFYDKRTGTATRIGTHNALLHTNFKKVSPGKYAFVAFTAATSSVGYIVDIDSKTVYDTFASNPRGIGDSTGYVIVSDGIVSISAVGAASNVATLQHRNITTKVTTTLLSNAAYNFEDLIDTETAIIVGSRSTTYPTLAVYYKDTKTVQTFANMGTNYIKLYEDNVRAVMSRSGGIVTYTKSTKTFAVPISNSAIYSTASNTAIAGNAAFMFQNEYPATPLMLDLETLTLTTLTGYRANNFYGGYGSAISLAFEDGLYVVSISSSIYVWRSLKYDSKTKTVTMGYTEGGSERGYESILNGPSWQSMFGDKYYIVKTQGQNDLLKVVTRDLMWAFSMDNFFREMHCKNFAFVEPRMNRLITRKGH